MSRRYEDDADLLDTADLRRDLRSDVSTRVLVPAIILIIINVLSLLAFACLFVFLVVMLFLHPPRNQPDDILGVTFAFGGTVVALIMKSLVTVGAIQMARMRTYPIAIGAAVLQMIPACSPCWVIDLPLGIWAFIILLLPDVREAFYMEIS